MKKVLSIVLSICMLLSISAGLNFSASALDSSGSCGENVSYTFDAATGLLTISGSGDMYDYGWNSKSPFYNEDKSEITRIVINYGVTSIGEQAFYGCRSLTSIEIPNSVKSIGRRAFEYCRSLPSIESQIALQESIMKHFLIVIL